MDFLNNRKTILAGVAMILYNAVGGFLGKIDPGTAVQGVIEGFGLIFLRLGISKVQPNG